MIFCDFYILFIYKLSQIKDLKLLGFFFADF